MSEVISQTNPIKAPELPDEALRRMNHEVWLGDFATALQTSRQKRGGIVTPFLAGAITKLQWAARYIVLLKADIHWLARDNKLLRKHIEHLGGIPAPPFRPTAELVAEPLTEETIAEIAPAIHAELTKEPDDAKATDVQG